VREGLESREPARIGSEIKEKAAESED